jgi:hypothetical protein
VLLVDADQAEVRHGREDGGAGADDHGRLAGDDSLALIAALRLGQARVQHRDPVAEAGLEAAERLGCQRDLRDEHDRTLAARERGRARLQIDLRLAAAGRAGEQEVRAGAVDRRHDPRHGPLLRLRQPGRLRLARHAGARLAAFPAPDSQLGRDELERACRGGAVVVAEPEREIDERWRQLVEDAFDRRRLDAVRRGDTGLDDDPSCGGPPETDRDDGPLPHSGRDLVGEDARDGAGGNERIDGGEQPSQRSDATRWPRRLYARVVRVTLHSS